MSPRALARLATALSISLVSCSAQRPVAHGPFLLRPTSHSIDLAARTWDSARLTLDLRTLAGSPVLSIEEIVPTRRHLFQLSGLEPGIRYAYRLSGITGGGDAVLEEGTASTAPRDASTPVLAAVVGDSGLLGFLRAKAQWQVAAGAATPRPDLLIHLGDIVYSLGGDPTQEFSEAFFEPFQGVLRHAPVCPTPGNHDQAIADGTAYDDGFFLSQGEGGRYYGFDYGPAHFASLDTSTLRGFTQAQLDWLERDLDASAAPWKIIFTHHPPIGANGDGRLDDPAELAPVLKLAQRKGVRLILAGHEHAYLRYKPQGADAKAPILVVSGGGGATLSRTVGVDARLERCVVAHHHLRLAISAERLDLEAVGLDGAVFDRIALAR